MNKKSFLMAMLGGALLGAALGELHHWYEVLDYHNDFGENFPEDGILFSWTNKDAMFTGFEALHIPRVGTAAVRIGAEAVIGSGLLATGYKTLKRK